MTDTKVRDALHVPASKSLEHFGSDPTRQRGIMPMIAKIKPPFDQIIR